MLAAYGQQQSKNFSNKGFINSLKRMGKHITSEDDLKKVDWENENLYKISPSGVEEKFTKADEVGSTILKPTKELKKELQMALSLTKRKGLSESERKIARNRATEIRAALKDQGDIVALPKSVGDSILKRLNETPTEGGKIFDRLQGLWKTAVTVPNPAYHSRNIVGDSFNAWRGGVSPKAIMDSLKGVHALNKVERSQLQIEVLPKELNNSDLQKMVQEALDYGAGRTGQIAGEIASQTAEKAPGKIGRTLGKGTANLRRELRRIAENREDVMRIAMYITGRRRGLSPEEASAYSNKFLYDYTELTPFERQLRRAIPFYTFTARNTRGQVETLLTRPGKFANLAAFQQELAQTTGLPVDWQNNLDDYQKARIPFGVPAPIRRVLGTGQVITPSLPATDLNRMAGINPLNYKDTFFATASLLGPWKMIAELAANKSLFTRSQIQTDTNPYVPAPTVIGKLYEAAGAVPGLQEELTNRFGIQKGTLGSNSKKVGWVWYGQTDYAMKQIPQARAVMSFFTPKGTKNRIGVPRGQEIVGDITGLSTIPYNPTKHKMDMLYERRAKLDRARKKEKDLHQGTRTKKYDDLGVQWHIADSAIKKYEEKTGKLKLPKKKRGRPRKSSPAGGGGFGSGFGSGVLVLSRVHRAAHKDDEQQREHD